MQGTWGWSLIQEDPSYRREAKAGSRNHLTCALEPRSHNCSLCAPESALHNKRSHHDDKPVYTTREETRSRQLEKSLHSHGDPEEPKINKIILKKKSTDFQGTFFCLFAFQNTFLSKTTTRNICKI